MVLHQVLGLLVGLLVSGVNFQSTSRSSITAISIAGIWESERCVVQERNGVRTSSRSVFVFLSNEWALELTQYSDQACTTPSQRAFFQGRYRIEGPSVAVTGAYDANFGFSMKRLTLYDDDLLGQANRGGCGTGTWTRSRERDVSSTGCLWVVPVSACREEFDLVKLDGDRLLLGERPAAGSDLCHEDRRARALRALPLVRRVRISRSRSIAFEPWSMIHELEGAPIMAGMVASKFSEMGTGGWAWILSDMKSVLETGSSM